MLTPLIRRFRLPVSFWQIVRHVSSLSSDFFFLDSVEHQPPDQRYSYLGWEPFLKVTLENNRLKLEGEINARYPARRFFPVMRRLFKKYGYRSKTKPLFFTGGAVGFWGYEMAQFCDAVTFRKKKETGIPLLGLGFYRDLVVYDHQKKYYYLVTHTQSSSAGERKRALRRIRHLKHILETLPSLKTVFQPFRLRKFSADISRAKFLAMVKKAKEYIRAGDIYQANLSQRFSFDFKGSSVELYHYLRDINPSPFMSFLKMGDVEIVSSSPERLIQKKGRYCETKPIAGTRPKRLGSLSRKKIREELIGNEKERAEHIMLLDLERNDLGRVCDYQSVRVKEMMRLEEYSHVIHIVSTVTGRLGKGKDGLDLIRAMFPGGTITGCPKIRCMEIIDELEPVKRGIYTGSIGYMDFNGDLDLNIVIRTLVLHKNKGYLQVGAGIVADSIPEKEYEETLHKGEALMEALAKAAL